MRERGFGLTELLVVLGLGGVLLSLGVMIASGLNRQASQSNLRVLNQELLQGGVEILRKEFSEARILGLTAGDQTGFAALVARGEGLATLEGISGNALSLALTGPLPAGLAVGEGVVLTRGGVAVFGRVASLSGSDLTVSLPAPCSALSGQSTGEPFRVIAVRQKTLSFTGGRLVLTEGGTSAQSETVPAPLRFSYIYGGGQGERVLSSIPSTTGAEVPGALYREGGNTFYLSGIALYAQGETGRAEALAVVGASPPRGSCSSLPGGSSTREGEMVVNITGPDAFFNNAYATGTAKVQLVAPSGTTSFPTVGSHRVSLRLDPGQNATLNAPLISAAESVLGRNLTYLYGPPMSQSIPGSSLSPFTPTFFDVAYGVLPGRVAYRVANPPAPPGPTSRMMGPVTCIPAQGRYANCSGVSLSETPTPIFPGVYIFNFPSWVVSRQGTLDGQTLSYDEEYIMQTASPTPVPVSSGTDTLITVTYNTTPYPGTLRVTIRGIPAGVNPRYTVQNASGATVATGSTALDQIFRLAPGLYRVVAHSVTWGGVIYDPSPVSAVLAISSRLPSEHTITYTIRPATLRVNMTGLPEGQGRILVSGPGYSQNLSGSATLTLTSFGNYTVTAQDVAYGGRTYRATVNPGWFNAVSGGSYTVAVDYVPITTLQIRFNNPTGGTCTNGTLRVTGPSGFSRSYNADTTEMPVSPGSYSASMTTQPSSSLYTCQATVTPTSLALAQGETGTFTVNISAIDGAFRITLQGYPYASLQSGHITVRSPSGTVLPNPSLSGNTLTYTRLAPGVYTVTPSSFTGPSGFQYTPSPASAFPQVSAGQTATLTINYTVSVPPNTTGLRLAVDCPTCTPWQRQSIQPLVCLSVSQTPFTGSVPGGYLTDCPRAVSR